LPVSSTPALPPLPASSLPPSRAAGSPPEVWSRSLVVPKCAPIESHYQDYHIGPSIPRQRIDVIDNNGETRFRLVLDRNHTIDDVITDMVQYHGVRREDIKLCIGGSVFDRLAARSSRD
jgi:hypothetical protein